jgi:GTP-binding protein HflX
VIDISTPRFEDQIQAVEAIIADLHLDRKAYLKVFNKQDLVDSEWVETLSRRHGAVAISAMDTTTLPPLIERMQSIIETLQLAECKSIIRGSKLATNPKPQAIAVDMCRRADIL